MFWEILLERHKIFFIIIEQYLPTRLFESKNTSIHMKCINSKLVQVCTAVFIFKGPENFCDATNQIIRLTSFRSSDNNLFVLKTMQTKPCGFQN